MRKVLLLCLVALAAISAGCKEKTSTSINFWDPSWLTQKPFVFTIYSDLWDDTVRYLYQDFYLVSDYPCSAITINGMQFNAVDETVENDSYTTFFDYHGDEDGPLINPGELCEYSFVMNDTEYSGHVIMPDNVALTLPEFFMSRDYSFSWSSNPNPDHYLLSYFLSTSQYIQGNGAAEIIQFKGNVKSYTIPKTKWAHLESVGRADFQLSALNYTRHGSGGLAVAFNRAENSAQVNGIDNSFNIKKSKESSITKAKQMLRLIRDGSIRL